MFKLKKGEIVESFYLSDEVISRLNKLGDPDITMVIKQFNGQFSKEEIEYLNGLNPTEKFNGSLTETEIAFLKEHGVSDFQIKLINKLLFKHKDGLTGYVDLVGDDLMPGPWFFHNMCRYGHLLDLDPKQNLSIPRINLAQPLIEHFGHHFLGTNQVFESRSYLLAHSQKKFELESQGIYFTDIEDGIEYEPDPGIILPDEPVIWAMNHRFKDDVLASVLAILSFHRNRPLILFFGSVPIFFGTFDGVLANMIGTILVNRKCSASRKAGQEKLKWAIEQGCDILMAPEGVLNKAPDRLSQPLWPGIYRMAKENGCQIVPIIHYLSDPTLRMPKELNPIHTVVDSPIDITEMGNSEEEALNNYRNLVATWYYLMMEKYGKTTRNALIGENESFNAAYERFLEDWLSFVEKYDTSIETIATYNPPGTIEPEEAFALIDNIGGRVRKRGFQRRY